MNYNYLILLLYESIFVTVEGVIKKFYGSVIFFSACISYTLAAHKLGGFKALRKCRVTSLMKGLRIVWKPYLSKREHGVHVRS